MEGCSSFPPSAFSVTSGSTQQKAKTRCKNWRSAQAEIMVDQFSYFLEQSKTSILPDQFLVSKQRAGMMMKKPKLRLNVLSETLPPDLLQSLHVAPPSGLSFVFFTKPTGRDANSSRFIRRTSPNLSANLASATPTNISSPKNSSNNPNKLDEHNRSNLARLELMVNSQLDWFDWRQADASKVFVGKEERDLARNLQNKRLLSRAVGKPEANLKPVDANLQKKLLADTAEETAVRALRLLQIKKKRDTMNEWKDAPVKKDVLQLAQEHIVLKKFLELQQLQQTSFAQSLQEINEIEFRRCFLSAKGITLVRSVQSGSSTLGFALSRFDWIEILQRQIPSMTEVSYATIWSLFDSEKNGWICVAEWLLACWFLVSKAPTAPFRYLYSLLEVWQTRFPEKDITISKLLLHTVLGSFDFSSPVFIKNDSPHEDSLDLDSYVDVPSTVRSALSKIPWVKRNQNQNQNREQDTIPFYDFQKFVAEYKPLHKIMIGGEQSEFEKLQDLALLYRKQEKAARSASTVNLPSEPSTY